jgi:hypothetical protein
LGTFDARCCCAGAVLDVRIAGAACVVQYADAAGAARACLRDGTVNGGHSLRVAPLAADAPLPASHAHAPTPGWYPHGDGAAAPAGGLFAAPLPLAELLRVRNARALFLACVRAPAAHLAPARCTRCCCAVAACPRCCTRALTRARTLHVADSRRHR